MRTSTSLLFLLLLVVGGAAVKLGPILFGTAFDICVHSRVRFAADAAAAP